MADDGKTADPAAAAVPDAADAPAEDGAVAAAAAAVSSSTKTRLQVIAKGAGGGGTGSAGGSAKRRQGGVFSAATSVQFMRELQRRKSASNIHELTPGGGGSGGGGGGSHHGKKESQHGKDNGSSNNATARIKTKVNSVKSFSESKMKKQAMAVSNNQKKLSVSVRATSTMARNYAGSKLRVQQQSSRKSSGEEATTDKEGEGEEEAAAATEAAEEARRSRLKKQTSLDRLMDQVMALTSLYPQIVANAAKRKVEKEELEKENDELRLKEEAEAAEQTSGLDEIFKQNMLEEEAAAKADGASRPIISSSEEEEEEEEEEAQEDDGKGISFSRIMAMSTRSFAVGRREFEADEIENEKEEVVVNEEEERKNKIKSAKSKYMQMFAKAEPEPELEVVIDTDPKSYGLWDSCQDIKILPTLMKAKREWHPPDWERMLVEMKAEGRDGASIDAALKEISQTRDYGTKKTGKYLMPEDLAWCRKHSRFRERDMLLWFKRFRSVSPSGAMEKDEFRKLFQAAFPFSDAQTVADTIIGLFAGDGKEGLDFKDFIITMDVVTCKNAVEKFRWASQLYDKRHQGSLDQPGLRSVLCLLDHVEENGFMDTPTQDEIDEIVYRRKMEPLKLVDERVTDIWRACEITVEGRVEIADVVRLADKMVYARE